MRLTCGKCDNGWICEEHPERPWPHDDCGRPGVRCENPECDFSIVATGLVFRVAGAHNARFKRRHTA